MKRGKVIIGVVLLSVIISIGFVSAGFFDTITGKASQQPQDIAITVTGTNPVVVEYIEVISNQVPIESATTTVVFEVRITDSDGVSDIDDSSVNAEFSRSGVTKNVVCSWQSDIDADTASYLCSIDMDYYDGAGVWNIKVSATDFGSGSLVEDTSATFTYLELKAMIISPAVLTWPSVNPGAVDQTSDTDPAIITNTGNYAGSILMNAIDLVGETNPAEVISASDFTIGLSTDGAECNAPETATTLVNVVATTIVGSYSNPGPAGTEEFYYCIPVVPLVSSQAYSTSSSGDNWYIIY